VEIHVQSRIRNSSQFEDVLAQLFVWGLLREAGFEARMSEALNEPDIEVSIASGSIPIEVKHIHESKNPAGVRAIIKKANSQIKASGYATGIVWIVIQRPIEVPVLSDELPADIDQYVHEARRALVGGSNRSAGQVVISWSDVLTAGQYPLDALYAVRHRSTLLEHPAPRAEPLLPTGSIQLGRTVTIWNRHSIEGTGPLTSAIGVVAFGQSFDDQQHAPGGVARAEAEDAIRNANGYMEFAVHGGSIILASKETATTGNPHVLIVVAVRTETAARIDDAYRLFVPQVDIRRLALNALEAFKVVLRRYGLPLRIWGSDVPLVVNVVLEGTPQQVVDSMSPTQDDRPFRLAALIRQSPERPSATEVAWAYKVRWDTYMNDVASSTQT
jgi:hypothetical protein